MINTVSQKPLFETTVSPFHDTYQNNFSFQSTMRGEETGVFQNITLSNGQKVAFKLSFMKHTLDILPRNEQDPTFFSVELKEVFAELQLFWEELANEAGCHLVQFQEPWYKKGFSEKEIQDHFVKKGYQYFTQQQSIFLGEMNILQRKAASYLKELKEGVVPDIIVTSKMMQDLFEDAKKKEATLVYSKRSETQFEYYFQGYEGVLSLVAIDNVFYLLDEKMNYQESIEKVVKGEGLLLLLDKIEKKKRIENIFNPPMYHIKQKLSYYENEKIKKIFSYLLNYYSAKEIEEYFAQKEVYILPVFSMEECRVLQLMGHYFIVEKYKQDLFKTAASKEEVKKVLYEMVDSFIEAN